MDLERPEPGAVITEMIGMPPEHAAQTSDAKITMSALRVRMQKVHPLE